MIPVGVGRGVMSSLERIAKQEINEKRRKKRCRVMKSAAKG